MLVSFNVHVDDTKAHTNIPLETAERRQPRRPVVFLCNGDERRRGDMAKDVLTPKQEKFVMAYNGNATDAARAAGYRNPGQIGSQLLQKEHIRAALRERGREELSDKIASRKERQAFWTAVMRDPGRRMQDRLKAAELLGKSEADFTERRELTGADGAPLIPSSITVNFIDCTDVADTAAESLPRIIPPGAI